MGRSKIAALVGAALFFLPSAGAFAADIPEIPQPAHFGGGWYLRGHIGMAAQHFGGLDHPDFATPVFFEWVNQGQFAAVPLFGVGIGWRHSDHLRFDLTGEYRSQSSFTALDHYDSVDPSTDAGTPGVDFGNNYYTGKKSELTFLANAYWDLGTWHNVTPYVGAGIGASYNSIYDFTDINVIGRWRMGSDGTQTLARMGRPRRCQHAGHRTTSRSTSAIASSTSAMRRPAHSRTSTAFRDASRPARACR